MAYQEQFHDPWPMALPLAWVLGRVRRRPRSRHPPSRRRPGVPLQAGAVAGPAAVEGQGEPRSPSARSKFGVRRASRRASRGRAATPRGRAPNIGQQPDHRDECRGQQDQERVRVRQRQPQAADHGVGRRGRRRGRRPVAGAGEPGLFLVLLAAALVAMIWLLPKIWRGLKAVAARVRGWLGGTPDAPEPGATGRTDLADGDASFTLALDRGRPGDRPA